MKATRIILLILALSVIVVSCNKQPLYKDKNAPIDERIESLLGEMTLDEKIEQLVGDSATGFDTKDNERLGIPGFKMTDGPIGVRWGSATAFPSGVSLAATWDTALTARYAQALALETKAKGRNYLLGPCINIHRFPEGGRNFESYGEDPYLTSRLAVNYIKALQENDVIASVKHFALNNQEWRRTEVDVQVDERAMREIYLPGFEAAVREAGVYTVMSAYNKVNGWWASENDMLLNKILKQEWDFKGLVVSDWVSTHSTVNAANNGLDVEMPHADVFVAGKLKAAIKSGEISEEVINDKVRRILRVKFMAGLFDQELEGDTAVLHGQEHKDLALEMAVNSIVLLKNDNNLLPLDLSKIKSIAVIGPNAKESPTGGGGSSHVNPIYNVSALDGITSLAKSAKVTYALGAMIPLTPVTPIPAEYYKTSTGSEGLNVEFFNNTSLSGSPVHTGIDKAIDFAWDNKSPVEGVGNDKYSIRWSGYVVIPESKEYTFYTASDDGVRLYIDNKLVINNWTDHGTTIDSAKIELTAGKSYNMKLEYFENGGSEIIQLGWNHGKSIKGNELIAEAVAAARNSDVAIVLVGSTAFVESEGYDRVGGLSMLAGQDELIREVTRANPRTIVVLYGGTPFMVSKWLGQTPALLQAFFPGQEGGNAIARLIFGEENFSGKLPFSYIKSPVQSPAYKGYKDTSLVASYSEGIYVGYRYLEKNNLEPSFAFGHGLSYTTFSYSDLQVTKNGDFNYTVQLKVKNTGARDGKEVVQLYIAPGNSSVDRPVKELKGFAKVSLKAGEEKTVTMNLNKRSFSWYDVAGKQWVADKGDYKVLVGGSSDDVKLEGSVSL